MNKADIPDIIIYIPFLTTRKFLKKIKPVKQKMIAFDNPSYTGLKEKYAWTRFRFFKAVNSLSSLPGTEKN